ncbi:(N-acetyl-beta-glucosaminyl)asparagine amidase [Seminavis robusta]|uniref:(N-acetyl-beta-glucosaminyl)asparagine amidase n=1 Tax=Seminavis robusta TaxID=568900 RepID=A0A9N8EY40_9STRA|nr:(N-acetyl-beta-glucosaminyl)asparagine amidase [Seminavis robusta]|eukprot:Sro2068_g313350.1 (N-acetyl-beta-glucosaminyl)asparagine amidase (474) ;mRNA; r:14867-16288
MSDPEPANATATESVHLQLNGTKEEDKEGKAENTTRTTIQVLTFVDPSSSELTWMAIGTSKRKFRAFLSFSKAIETSTSISNDEIQTRALSIPDGPTHTAQPIASDDNKGTDEWLSYDDSLELRRKFRDLWKVRRLLTTDTSWIKEHKPTPPSSTAAPTPAKRGSFDDKLLFQVERFEEILQDEREATPSQSLLAWLKENYGEKHTLNLQADRYYGGEFSAEEQLKTLQHFLDWFRSLFPYYYDRCVHCGASMKDDRAKEGTTNDTQDKDDDGDDSGTYLGQMCPSVDELKIGKASRVEVYQCHKCQKVYGFPRFNAAWSIVQTKRGRCGEYSILLYRMLRALGHANTARYVVDWADHVWVELQRQQQSADHSDKDDQAKYGWIHLDPCEAAVDNPLLYQSWGKKATYLIALYAPTEASKDVSSVIEDVTNRYTSDSWDQIGERRQAHGETNSGIQQAIDECTVLLRTKLAYY